MTRAMTLALLLIAGVCVSRPAAGVPAPDFRLIDLDGVSHTLAQHRGKVVLLSFWASWCAGCKRETPSLVKLHALRRNDLVVMGITVNDAVPNVRAFADQQKITYTLLMDDDGEVAALYEVDRIPTNIIVAADGEVHETIVGFGTVLHFEAFVLRSLYELIPRPVAPRGKATVTWAALKSR